MGYKFINLPKQTNNDLPLLAMAVHLAHTMPELDVFELADTAKFSVLSVSHSNLVSLLGTCLKSNDPCGNQDTLIPVLHLC